MKSLIIKLTLAFFVTIMVFAYISKTTIIQNNSKSKTETVKSQPKVLGSRLIEERFLDEPQFTTFKNTQSNGWFSVEKPTEIKESTLTPWEYIKTDKQAAIEKSWTFSDDNFYINELDKFVDKQKLSSSYRTYFYKTAQIPYEIITNDFNGDGEKDQAFVSVGVGCASCRYHYIDIFIKNKRYSTGTDGGMIYPLKYDNGFYLDENYTGDDTATCCLDNIRISKFTWINNKFVEQAKKRINILADKDITVKNESDALNILENKIGKNTDKCVFYIKGEYGEYYQIEKHGLQNDKDCPGDPHVSPLIIAYRVNKINGKVTYYDVIKDKFFEVK